MTLPPWRNERCLTLRAIWLRREFIRYRQLNYFRQWFSFLVFLPSQCHQFGFSFQVFWWSWDSWLVLKLLRERKKKEEKKIEWFILPLWRICHIFQKFIQGPIEGITCAEPPFLVQEKLQSSLFWGRKSTPSWFFLRQIFHRPKMIIRRSVDSWDYFSNHGWIFDELTHCRVNCADPSS